MDFLKKSLWFCLLPILSHLNAQQLAASAIERTDSVLPKSIISSILDSSIIPNNTILITDSNAVQSVALPNKDSLTTAKTATVSVVFQQKTIIQRLQQKKNTPYLVAGTAAGISGGVYFLLKNTWWKASGKFHFDKGRDFRYANNLDKFGHFLGGVTTSDLYDGTFQWLGHDAKKSALYGFYMAVGFQTLMEIKDGLAENWGFSWADVTAGSLGGLWHVGRQHYDFFKNTDVKFSYWQRSDKFFARRPHAIKRTAFHVDDYLNQTYWFSTSLNYLTANKIKGLPDWLNISVGFGIDADTWDEGPIPLLGEGGDWEFFFAPDINLEKLFKPKKKVWKTILHSLNYLKFPMPTIQIGPYKPRYHWLYF